MAGPWDGACGGPAMGGCGFDWGGPAAAGGWGPTGGGGPEAWGAAGCGAEWGGFPQGGCGWADSQAYGSKGGAKGCAGMADPGYGAGLCGGPPSCGSGKGVVMAGGGWAAARASFEASQAAAAAAAKGGGKDGWGGGKGGAWGPEASWGGGGGWGGDPYGKGGGPDPWAGKGGPDPWGGKGGGDPWGKGGGWGGCEGKGAGPCNGGWIGGPSDGKGGPGGGFPGSVPTDPICGLVKGFDEEKGFGFVQGDGIRKMFGKDVFLTKVNLGEQSVQVGDQVRFVVHLGPKGPQATDVHILPRGSFISSGVEAVVYNGTVKNYKEDKGWGFVTSERTQELFAKDIFLHRRELPEGISALAGEPVEFTIKLNQKAIPEATTVKLTSRPNVGYAPVRSTDAPGGLLAPPPAPY